MIGVAEGCSGASDLIRRADATPSPHRAAERRSRLGPTEPGVPPPALRAFNAFATLPSFLEDTMVAPVASPTVVPRSPVFPRLLPLPPHPHPIPPAPSFQRRERFINYRDIWREMEELSEEEDAVEDQVCTILTRSDAFTRPD